MQTSGRSIPSEASTGPKPLHPLTQVACGLLTILPLAMTAANRSAPLIVTFAALAAAGALFANIRRELGPQPLSGIEPLRLFYVLAITIGGLAWLSRGADLTALGEAFVSVLAAAIVISSLERPLPRWLPVALAATMGLACVWLVAELEGDMLVRRMLGLRPNSFIFNRTVVTLTLMLWPALALILMTGPSGRHLWRPIASVLMVAVLGYAVIRSDSGAATFGLGLGLVTYALARIAPRVAVLLAGAGFLAALMLAPVIGNIAASVMPAGLHEQLASSNSRARVAIWQSFGAAVTHAPVQEIVLGQGFGTSAGMATRPIAEAVPQERRTLLGSGHPHNAYLQVWVELGLVGVCVVAGLLGLLLLHLWRGATSLLPTRLALVASAGMIALVGHGAWQGWWLAVLGAAWALFPGTSREERRT